MRETLLQIFFGLSCFVAGWIASNLYRNYQEYKMWYGDRK